MLLALGRHTFDLPRLTRKLLRIALEVAILTWLEQYIH